jgi:hypothetical protein
VQKDCTAEDPAVRTSRPSPAHSIFAALEEFLKCSKQYYARWLASRDFFARGSPYAINEFKCRLAHLTSKWKNTSNHPQILAEKFQASHQVKEPSSLTLIKFDPYFQTGR